MRRFIITVFKPDVPNYGDMTTLPERILSGEVEAPDILCGGTPCQAFSVAGLRKSLDDDRGNLSLKFCEVADAIDSVRTVRGLKQSIIFWENVPGVLNTKDNAFGCFLGQLVGADAPPYVRLRPMAECRLCCRTQKESGVESPRCSIFRSPPTTPTCLCCRKCSRRIRSRRNTF